jgi:menaquinone-9 beta-reductase
VSDRSYDVIIVGGGPAGSSAAWALTRAGRSCLVLDKESWPRLKLCAGWITPQVVESLELDLASYPHALITFPAIEMEYFSKRGSRRIVSRYPQHSIRRCEFDHWLLERSGAEVRQHTVRQIVRDGNELVVDGEYRARYLVGAGGTSCPVYRALFKEANPRSAEYQIAALEQEIQYDYEDPRCLLWLGEFGLVGYSWYVPKGRGWVNVGLGGFSQFLRDGELSLHEHWALFVKKLEARGLIRGYSFSPKGYTYYVREPAPVVQLGNAFIAGDAAGLATRDFAEGIGPAVSSGLGVADSILSGEPYSLRKVIEYSALGATGRFLFSRLLDRKGTLFRDRVFARHFRAKQAAARRLS